ncbi:hypothetical protein NT2_12_00660 [Caenibius tardaugens NBRC 16725]|uniref:Methyltransferase n=1 Tax=Caenibius tardaugens NBRC 16725 TaxID=1219035 RepID=U2YQ67_9SPHN|nr:methyltransferase domain-containing protein [Caenibius tardaugens]AZI36388.1 methyltransferase domain-containing protein [Caenibius tardaugens NBRC 16725]GAD50802.1 hypothetical protein NT2_12_00660 [Caenibius tardaugens NBRC 16725]
MRRFLVMMTAVFGLSSPPLVAEEPAAADPPVCAACEAVMELALADPRRTDDRARDAYRHPAATLAFFRVVPGMTVVDYAPSGGWWTRILVPYLGKDGHYIGLNPDVRQGDEQQKRYFGGLGAAFPAKAAEWTGVPASRIAAYNADDVPAARNGTVDRVLMFRMLHNLQRMGLLDAELATIHRLLKPDGLLGIEQHRAKADAPDAYVDGSKGYLRQADVIRRVEAQGFKLVAASEINANAADSADYPEGVWELPPSLRTKREELKAIGESDRMTLLFRKTS